MDWPLLALDWAGWWVGGRNGSNPMAIHLEQILYIGLGTAVAQNDRRKRNWTSKNNKKQKQAKHKEAMANLRANAM